jgi:hypothetical protein
MQAPSKGLASLDEQSKVHKLAQLTNFNAQPVQQIPSMPNSSRQKSNSSSKGHARPCLYVPKDFLNIIASIQVILCVEYKQVVVNIF